MAAPFAPPKLSAPAGPLYISRSLAVHASATGIYFTMMNVFCGAPQIPHTAGMFPLMVFPQIGHTA